MISKNLSEPRKEKMCCSMQLSCCGSMVCKSPFKLLFCSSSGLSFMFFKSFFKTLSIYRKTIFSCKIFGEFYWKPVGIIEFKSFWSCYLCYFFPTSLKSNLKSFEEFIKFFESFFKSCKELCFFFFKFRENQLFSICNIWICRS